MPAKPERQTEQSVPLFAPSKHVGSKTQLIPVSQWNERHPWPPKGGLRHLIFFAETNGFNKVIRRIGRRVLIDEEAFFEWANDQTGSK